MQGHTGSQTSTLGTMGINAWVYVCPKPLWDDTVLRSDLEQERYMTSEHTKSADCGVREILGTIFVHEKYHFMPHYK